MKRAWVGVALLSASWLFGLSYYHHANWLIWTMLVVAGIGLLAGVRLSMPSKIESAIALVLLVPPIAMAPWPYRVAPLSLFVGLALTVAPIPRRWPKALGSGALAAGTILTAQSLAMLAYESITARSHELPRPLASMLYALARLVGIDATLDNSDLVLNSVRAAHRLGATWELLVDPPTLCFLVGGVTLLCMVSVVAPLHASRDDPQGLKGTPNARHRVWEPKPILRAAAPLVLLIGVWLPARAALLMSILVHRALRTGYDNPLVLMNQFWSPWISMALLSVPVLLVLRFATQRPAESVEAAVPSARKPDRRFIVAAVCVFVGVFLFCIGLLWDPMGKRKEGRVLVDEHRSTWERTDRPFDTQWYGQESGYNYACIYDYCSRFYQMARLNEQVNDRTLQDCDVLVVKVPTSRYDLEEIAAMERFVEKGGGLLLVGEHTNVFNTSTHINDIARRFGFLFRHDCLFDIDAVFEQLWRRPLAAHPIVASVPLLDFAVSCSISPGAGPGRAVIRSTGLRNLPADYHVSNFYPQVEDHAYSRYGTFIQLWARRCGAGRVAAFTDSTIFSNFSTFEPGKAELMLGTLEWLNHRNSPFDPRPWLLIGGAALGVGGLIRWSRISHFRFQISDFGLKKTVAANPQSAIRNPQSFALLLAVGMFGWATAVMAVQTVHDRGMSLPQPARPFVHVVMDRTICDTPLSKSGFIAGEENGFAIFERWILRLGYFTSRRNGADALAGDLVVFAYPSRAVSQEFRDAVVNYVASGGKVLVLDSPENASSTANSLLYPFGLSLDSSRTFNGSLKMPDGQPAVGIEAACQVLGGEPVLSLDGAPVAATVRHGKGSVTAVGFASRFTDARMGVTGDVVPDDELRRVFELEFTLLKDIISIR